MTIQHGDRQKADYPEITANGPAARRKVDWTNRCGKDRRSGGDRRQVYDADYFAGSGVERRRGSWERRTSGDRRPVKYRKVALKPNYVYLRERQSGAGRRKEKVRRTSPAVYFIWL